VATTYEIELRYVLDDKASKALDAIASRAARTESSLSSIKSLFGKLAAVFTVEKGFEYGKKLFIDLNSQMEEMKIRMAGIASYNLGTPFAATAKETDRLVESWRKFAQTTALTTTEIVEFGTNISSAVLGIGGTMQDLERLSKQGALVGQVLSAGHPGGMKYAALEMREALMGNLRQTQIMNVQLLGPVMRRMGMDLHQWNRLTTQERLRIMFAAVEDPAWKDALKKIEGSWKNVYSNLEDAIENIGRQIGTDLFETLKKHLKSATDWMKDHKYEVDQFSKKFSGYLIEGFNVIKNITKFIVDHKDELLEVAKAYLAIKGISMAGAVVSGVAGGATKLMAGGGAGALATGAAGWLGTNFGVLGAGVAAAGAPLLAAASGLAAGVGAGWWAANYIDEQQTLAERPANMTDYSYGVGQAVGRARELAQEHKRLPAAVPISQQAFGPMSLQQLEEMRRDPLRRNEAEFRATLGPILALVKQADAMTEKGEFVADSLKKYVAGAGADVTTQENLAKFASEAVELSRIMGTLAKFFGFKEEKTDQEGGRGSTSGKDVNVNINTIEVASDDPDRFVEVFTTKMAALARNPASARGALPSRI
jgi:hypothetical protein